MIESVIFDVDGTSAMAEMNRTKDSRERSVRELWWHAGALGRDGRAPVVRRGPNGWIATSGVWARADKDEHEKYERLFGGGGRRGLVPATEIVVRAKVRGGSVWDNRLYRICAPKQPFVYAVVEWDRNEPDGDLTFNFVLEEAGPQLAPAVDYQPFVILPDWCERLADGVVIRSPPHELSIEPLH